VNVGSPHIAVAGTAVRVYCSDDCLRGLSELVDLDALEPIEASPRRAPWWLAAGFVVGGGVVVYQAVLREEPPRSVPLVFVAPEAAPPVAADTQPEVPPPAPDAELLRDLMQDAWIHPLAGPKRRMPINHTGAFGAVRNGQPPPECLSGHCGVDVGSTWGEPIHAVHDGVVDWVNRGPNEERGGIFVKIAHRSGALYSWYFHLAAVPRWIVPGAKIAVGQVIGLLGDTGIKRSAPHLHFAMTVKPPAGARERYLDPEPLIAIWPLWIVEDGKGHASTAEPPGMPVRIPPRKRRAAPVPRSEAAAPGDDLAPIAPAAPPAPAAKVTEPEAAPSPSTTTN
jgi:murein DD-endopeptidase MepM/ murein hydrolase activator NlpD